MDHGRFDDVPKVVGAALAFVVAVAVIVCASFWYFVG